MLTIACVLRSGGHYDAEYVARLRAGISANLAAPHRFICLSDVEVPCERILLKHQWAGWWAKLELMRPDIRGQLLYFDLDTIITGPLDAFAEVGRLTMLSDFFQPQRPASGLMYLTERARRDAWHLFIRDPGGWMRRCGTLGDQEFLKHAWGHRPARWQDLLPGKVVSYKAAQVGRRGISSGTSVVAFHGRPRPREVGWRIPTSRR